MSEVITVGYYCTVADTGKLVQCLAGGSEFSTFKDISKMRSDAALDCDVILTGFADDRERSEAVLTGGPLADVAPGTVVLDLTGGLPDETRAFAKVLGVRGVDLVVALVSGHFKEDTDVPRLVITGGSDVALARVRNLVDRLAQKSFYCDEPGKASALHLLVSSLALTTQVATLEVVAMGRKFGLDVSTMADVISKGSGKNRTSQIVLPGIASGQETSDFSLDEAVRILGQAAESGRRNGAPLLGTNIASGLVQAAMNRFGASASMDAAASLIESMAATKLMGSPPRPPVAKSECADSLRVGFVGVGTMGAALARRLMQSRPVMVYDLNEDSVRAIENDGAIVASDPVALARDCDVIFTCLPTSAHVRQAIFGEGGLAEGLAPGKVIVDQTTGNPSETRQIAEDLEKLGVAMVDAPVSGGTRGAVAGTIAIICGGPAETFASVHPVLEQISPNIVYCGAIGNGHAGKLVQNAVAACNRVMTLECVAAACKCGLTLTDMIDPVNTGAAWNGGAERIIPALRTDSPTTQFAMGLMVKDLRMAMDIGNEIGAPMLIANIARGLMQSCSNELGPTSNLDAIAYTVGSMAGVTFADHA